MSQKKGSTTEHFHTLTAPMTDTRGNQHDVRYEENARTKRARYVHSFSCWCRRQAAFS